MDLTGVRQVSSAGRRVSQRPKEIRPASSPAAGDRRTQQDPAEHDRSRKNAVKQDELWKDLVCRERRQAQQWEKTWDFLLKSDTLGGPREEISLPNNISVFSDSSPNTTNQIYGNRQFTPLGREMVRRDRLILWSGSHRRRMKPDLELQPC
ncbi:PREDICTED: uncharacterized protein C2orf50 homolog [Cyprinodon variegatus]|uniref:uncharacterized protein C2orf50 homolog n=1 Tax=Cyprinodon variegatus TaxID=28743 RepID=UPI000742A323|nr:PREDICTED: uncharacterized protein C2orf50 homolog [Cyprinodon variegatus]